MNRLALPAQGPGASGRSALPATSGVRRFWVTVGLAIAGILLTRHPQMSSISWLLAPWLIGVVIAGMQPRRDLVLVLPVVLFGLVSVLTAVAKGNDPEDALRFLVVVVFTLLAFSFRPTAINEPWALAPLAVQAAVIVAISVAFAVMQDPDAALAVRLGVLDAGWGDIYSFDGFYYRVQIIGNALIPLLFMICLWRAGHGRVYKILLGVAAAGLIAAGNVTYMIVVCLALLVRHGRALARSGMARFIALVLAAALMVAGWDLATEITERKFEGSDSSMGVRFDQVDVLVGAFADSPTQLLFGAGLGTRFPDGRERTYSQFRYIELQALYLLLQIGVIGMAIYLGSLFALAHRTLSRDGRILFWLYMLSGITNPYILDSNQILATLLLVCCFPRRANERAKALRTSGSPPPGAPPAPSGQPDGP